MRALPRAPAACAPPHSATGEHTLAVIGYLEPDASTFERLSLAGRMMKEAAGRNPETVGLSAPGTPAQSRAGLEALLAAALAHAFELPSFRAPARDTRRIRRLQLIGARDVDTRFATAAARGGNLARWLTALPPNVLDARGYRSAITRLARTHGLSLRWLDERALRRRGANAFLAVAAGNAEGGAGIAHLKYRPARRRAARPDVALVGKGILFDTGGINLKTHRSMLDMHTDMSGSAVALATLVALAELRAPLAADAWLAITENRIGPHAYRPQEVVRAANGVTIQVIHTDAEGRMVLADTLALAALTRPRFMLDFATLTGACVYCAHRAHERGVHQPPRARPRALRGGPRERRARLELPVRGGLRPGSREPRGRRRAMRAREQGRSHPRDALPQPLRAGGSALGARGPVVRDPQRRTRTRRHRRDRLRRAFCAGAAAAPGPRCGP